MNYFIQSVQNRHILLLEGPLSSSITDLKFADIKSNSMTVSLGDPPHNSDVKVWESSRVLIHSDKLIRWGPPQSFYCICKA